MSEKPTLREAMEQLGREWNELKRLVLTEVAAHFWGLLSLVLLMIGGMVLVGLARPEWLT